MRAWILSDLHVNYAPFMPAIPDAFDVVVLAGDIDDGVRAMAIWLDAFRELVSAPVIYVYGSASDVCPPAYVDQRVSAPIGFETLR